MMNVAIQNGNVRTVLVYLSLKGQINYCDILTGDSFLHRAIQYNQLNIFGFLLLVTSFILTFNFLFILILTTTHLIDRMVQIFIGKINQE